MSGYYVAPSLQQLLKEVNAIWSARDNTSDGALGNASHQATKSDHNPDYDSGGVIRARDIDEDLQGSRTPYPHFGTGRGADPLVRRLLERCRSGAEKRVAYIIYERRIYSATKRGTDGELWGPRPYRGVNAHDHHAHVSIKHGDRYENDRSPWLPPQASSARPSSNEGDDDMPSVEDVLYAREIDNPEDGGDKKVSLAHLLKRTLRVALGTKSDVDLLQRDLAEVKTALAEIRKGQA